MECVFHVYIMAGGSGMLYTGVTRLPGEARKPTHNVKFIPRFTRKYNGTKLAWFEAHNSVRAAIAREKEIKAWRRSKKVTLIESLNPQWKI